MFQPTSVGNLTTAHKIEAPIFKSLPIANEMNTYTLKLSVQLLRIMHRLNLRGRCFANIPKRKIYCINYLIKNVCILCLCRTAEVWCIYSMDELLYCLPHFISHTCLAFNHPEVPLHTCRAGLNYICIILFFLI